MSRVRTFLAVDVSPSLRARIAALQEALARAGATCRWSPPASFHITVLFLGDVEDRELDRLCRIVAQVCSEHTPFDLRLEGVGCFPGVARPRVVWTGIGEGADELRALNDSLATALGEAGLYFGDAHGFNPHLTLGRVKNAEGIAAALEAKAGWSGGSCEVNEVLVMASDPSRYGPEYSVLSTAPLA